MEKVALITDTTADVPQEIIDKYNINVLCFRIIYKDREYRDKIEITAKQVYDNLNKEIPTSSMPALQDMEDLYDKLEKEGYTHAIAVTLSSGLSGIYNGLRLVSEGHPKIKSFIFDSKNIALGEGAQIIKCGEMIEKGKSFEEIVEALPGISSRMHTFFIVDTLEYLIKGGRIGKVSGTIGQLLNLKPIISIGQDGKYYTYYKTRGKNQALNKMLEIAKKFTETKECEIFMEHGNGEEDTMKLMEQVEKLPNVKSILYGGCLSPVSGAHSGPGLVGLVFLEEE